MTRQNSSPLRIGGFCASLFVVFSCGSCAREAAPEDVFRTYLQHLSQGKFDEAFELIATESKARLAVAEARWVRGEPDALLPPEGTPAGFEASDGRALFRRLVRVDPMAGGSPLPENPGRLVRGVRIDDQTAVVQVIVGDQTKTVRMVRETRGFRAELKLPLP